MRPLLLGLLVLGLAAPAAAACGGPAGWTPDVERARAWAAARQHALVAFSVRSGDRAWHVRADRTVPAASVTKAVLLVAELQRLRDRPLPAVHRAQLDAMVRRSDDVAATRVRDRVTSTGLQRAARRAGMRAWRTHHVWGLSRLSARDGARLMAGMEALLPPRHRAFGLRLLRTVVPSQRWGVGQAVPAGWTAFLKGGWGSGSGAVNHQVALLARGCERVALAVLTTSGPSHAYGERTLRGVAARLLRGLGSPPGGGRASARRRARAALYARSR